MLYYKLVTDKSGKQVKNYYMTQGDTFQNQLSIKDAQGVEIAPENIQEVRFKLSDLEYNEEFTQLYEYDETINKWLIEIDTQDTSKWEINTHIYEYQIIYTSGVVSTPIQAKFTIQNQIKEG